VIEAMLRHDVCSSYCSEKMVLMVLNQSLHNTTIVNSIISMETIRTHTEKERNSNLFFNCTPFDSGFLPRFGIKPSRGYRSTTTNWDPRSTVGPHDW